MDREKVTFATNVPVPVVLEYDDGQVAAGRFGDQYKYTLQNNRIMWVDPQVRDAIRATGARAGDEVIITKKETRQGTKRAVQWIAELRAEEPAEAATARAWADLPQCADTAPRDTRPAPQPPAPPPPRQAAAPIAPASSRATAAPIPAAAPADTPAHAPYFEAFRQAIETARDVEAYGASIGRPVAFNTEDLRCMAATLYMGARR